MYPTFTIPLTSSDRLAALRLLEQDQSVRIGPVTLHPEASAAVVWGCDPDGVDCVAANGAGRQAIARAIAWAEHVAAKAIAAVSSGSMKQ